MRNNKSICVVIPALDEEAALPGVLDRIPTWVDRTIVVDNGSLDGTSRVAAASGALVVCEPERGYGRACMAGIRAGRDFDILVFLDADGSDHPEQMHRLVDPIVAECAGLVIGSRTRGNLEPGAMSLPQRMGNFLAPLLIRLFWGQVFSDLGPFRAVSSVALGKLQMNAPTYGWTVQMQIRAARLGVDCLEVPVDYSRRRAGRSKISGTLSGVLGASVRILSCVAAELWLTYRRPRSPREPSASPPGD